MNLQPCIRANSGGPASRARSELVVASVLRENDSSKLRLPRVTRAAIDFGRRDPLDAMLELMARAGLDDAECLRDRYTVPPSALLVRVVPDARWCVRLVAARDDVILYQALVLGLCTAFQFDPRRPVLWTRASLTRRVELYEPTGFYA